MRPVHALILATCIWGGTFSLIRDALQTMDPVLFVALRFALAAPFALVLFHSRIDLKNRVSMQHGFLLGVSLYAGYMLQTLGLVYTTASRSGFFTSLTVVFVPLLLSLERRKRPRGGVLLALVFVLGGVLLLSHSGTAALPGAWRGDLYTIACAFCFAFQVLLMDRLPEQSNSWSLNFWQIVTVAILAALTLPFRTAIEFNPQPITWLALGFCGLFATVVALALQVCYQPRTTPEKAAVVYTLEPVFAAGFAFLWAGELLTLRELLGGLLICCGLWAVEQNRSRLRALKNMILP